MDNIGGCTNEPHYSWHTQSCITASHRLPQVRMYIFPQGCMPAMATPHVATRHVSIVGDGVQAAFTVDIETPLRPTAGCYMEVER
ncbi:MAG: hypothetical protein ACK4M3_03140 [Pyrobaculum sp.]